MAARRLIIVMLVLLGMSTLAAALAPPPQSGDRTTTTTATRPKRHEPPTGGQLVERTMDAQAKRPQSVNVPLGDQLSLTVKSSRAGQVEIPDLGLLQDVTPVDPARFDILVSSKGRHEVRTVDKRRVIGLLEFKKPERGNKREAQ